MERNLVALNCAPVRFADSPKMSLEPGERDGLNSGVNFDIVMVDTQLVDNDILGKMQQLQPNAKVSSTIARMLMTVYLPRSRHRSGRSYAEIQHQSKCTCHANVVSSALC